jgi:non-ribosomal peptide synthase protein (TIGR01720 family)
VKAALRAVPGRGMGYGLLRYLSAGEGAQRLRQLPAPTVGFHYLGQFDAALPAHAPFRLAPEEPGANRSAHARRTHPFVVIGLVVGGCLSLHWEYSVNQFQPATVEALARSYITRLMALLG